MDKIIGVSARYIKQLQITVPSNKSDTQNDLDTVILL